MSSSHGVLEIPLTRASHLTAVLDCLDDLGLPYDAALARCRLPGPELDPAAMLPVLPILRFCAEVSRREDVPDLGLRVACQQPGSALPPAVRWRLLTAPTLYAALGELVQACATVSSHVRMWSERRGGSLWFKFLGSTPVTAPGAELSEHHRLALIISLVRVYLGPRWSPQRVDLESTTAPPEALREFLGGCECRGGMPAGGVPIPWRSLSTPGAPGESVPTQARSPELLAPVELNGWIDLLRQVLPPYLASGRLSEPFIAELLGVSRRTLQRNLQAAGQTYSELVDRVRLEEARRLLADPDMTVREAAVRLGYNHPSNFNRAFRRLAGSPPSEFRQRTPRPPRAASETR